MTLLAVIVNEEATAAHPFVCSWKLLPSALLFFPFFCCLRFYFPYSPTRSGMRAYRQHSWRPSKQAPIVANMFFFLAFLLTRCAQHKFRVVCGIFLHTPIRRSGVPAFHCHGNEPATCLLWSDKMELQLRDLWLVDLEMVVNQKVWCLCPSPF